MSSRSSFSELFFSLLTQFPLMLVCVVGFILVLLRSRQLGKAALPAMIGLGLATALPVMFIFFWTFIFPEIISYRSNTVIFHRLISFFQSALWAVSIALFVFSIMLKPRAD